MNFFRNHWPFLVLLVIFLVSRLLAVYAAGSLWFDEAFSVHFSAMDWPAMWQHLQYEHNPLLPFALLHLWMNWFGDGEMTIRLLSVLVGTLSLVGIYHLGSRLFTKTVGWWAAFFMTASTTMLYHQTEARMYSLVVLFSVLLLLSFLKLEERANRSNLLFYVLSGIALTQTHITGWSLVLAIFFYQIARWPQQKPSRKEVYRWIVAHVIIATVFLLWFVPVALNKIETGGVAQGWFFAQHERGYWTTHLTNVLVNGEDRMPVRSITAMLSLILLLASFLSIERPSWWQRVQNIFAHDRWPLSVVVHWTPQIRLLFFCLMIPLLLGFALQVTVTKYLLVTTIPLFLLMGQGAARIAKNKRRSAALSLSVILLVLPIHLRLYTSARHHWDQAAESVVSLKLEYPDAPILVHSFAYALPLQRYLPPDTQLIPFYPLTDNLTLDERVVRYNWQGIATAAGAREFVANISANKLILVSSTPKLRDEDPLKAALFAQGWRITDSKTWNGYGDPELLLLER